MEGCGPCRRPHRRARGAAALAGLALGVAAAALGACGVRLEDDAPRVPLIPTRTPVPAETELTALTRETDRLAGLAGDLPGDLEADLATIHRRQHAVLRTTLVREQVPVDTLDASPSPVASGPAETSANTPPSTSPGATPSAEEAGADRAALAEEEARSAARSGDFAGVDDDLLAPVAALHAQRYAAATLLSGRSPEVPADPVSGDDVARLAGRTAAAVWFLEVVAARSAGGQRARAERTLASLRALLADQEAGGSRPPETLGHPLPFPVETSAQAARLAREVLTTLRSEHGAALEPLAVDHGATGIRAPHPLARSGRGGGPPLGGPPRSPSRASRERGRPPPALGGPRVALPRRRWPDRRGLGAHRPAAPGRGALPVGPRGRRAAAHGLDRCRRPGPAGDRAARPQGDVAPPRGPRRAPGALDLERCGRRAARRGAALGRADAPRASRPGRGPHRGVVGRGVRRRRWAARAAARAGAGAGAAAAPSTSSRTWSGWRAARRSPAGSSAAPGAWPASSSAASPGAAAPHRPALRERAPLPDGRWVAIDPKPVAGHPGFEVWPRCATAQRRWAPGPRCAGRCATGSRS